MQSLLLMQSVVLSDFLQQLLDHFVSIGLHSRICFLWHLLHRVVPDVLSTGHQPNVHSVPVRNRVVGNWHGTCLADLFVVICCCCVPFVVVGLACWSLSVHLKPVLTISVKSQLLTDLQLCLCCCLCTGRFVLARLHTAYSRTRYLHVLPTPVQDRRNVDMRTFREPGMLTSSFHKFRRATRQQKKLL